MPHSSPQRLRSFWSAPKNRDLWPSTTPKVRDSRTTRHSAHAQNQFGLVLVSIYCVYKTIQNRNVVGPGQGSRFLVLTKRSAKSEDENDIVFAYRGGHKWWTPSRARNLLDAFQWRLCFQRET